jgi:hypothetical protein
MLILAQATGCAAMPLPWRCITVPEAAMSLEFLLTSLER